MLEMDMTHDSTHVRLLRGELRQNMRYQELFHVVLHVWMPHDEVTERRRHVQCSEPLRSGRLPDHALSSDGSPREKLRTSSERG